MVVAFFLPWMAGEDVFALRTFTGFDLARLVRNFEITATSTPETSRVRAGAVALYLLPALAINGAVLHQLRSFNSHLRLPAIGAMVVAIGYGVLVLTTVLLFSFVAINDFEKYVGAPRAGFYLSAAGLTALATAAVAELLDNGRL